VRWVLVLLAGCDAVFGLGDPSGGGLTDFTCPPSYMTQSGHHYNAVNAQVGFANAELTCEMDAVKAGTTGFTHLAVLAGAMTTHEDRSLLAEDLAFFGTDPQTVWVGMSDNNATQIWEWVTVEQPELVDGVEPWDMNEPVPGAMKCAALSPINGLLSARNCADLHYGICECDGFAADLTRF
jgi:hypothetical protein